MALRHFDKQHQGGGKATAIFVAPGEKRKKKSIESDYLERAQVESRGGPRHVCDPSLPGARAVSPVRAVSG